jgi:hypothetical protein
MQNAAKMPVFENRHAMYIEVHEYWKHRKAVFADHLAKNSPKRKTRHVIFYTHAGYPWGHLSLAKAK